MTQRPQAIHEPQWAPTLNMVFVVETILREFDDYVGSCSRTQTRTPCPGSFADFACSSPADQADNGVTIYFNRMMPGIPHDVLAAKLTDEFVNRGKHPRADFMEFVIELHVPYVF